MVCYLFVLNVDGSDEDFIPEKFSDRNKNICFPLRFGVTFVIKILQWYQSHFDIKTDKEWKSKSKRKETSAYTESWFLFKKKKGGEIWICLQVVQIFSFRIVTVLVLVLSPDVRCPYLHRVLAWWPVDRRPPPRRPWAGFCRTVDWVSRRLVPP